MIGRYYRIDLDIKDGQSGNYVGPRFSCVEEAVMWAQSNGYITYNEDEERFEGDRVSIVEFFD